MRLARRALPALALAACATRPPTPTAPCAAVSVWVLDRAWHTEIALATAAIEGELAGFVPLFPGARTLLFGFGKRSWMVAPARGFGELLAGPFPGEGIMQVIAWSALPDGAADRPALGLDLDAAARRRLGDFIAASFARDAAGRPLLVGSRDGAVFYVATRRYGLDYTCNAWTAEALAAAGLPLRPAGTVWVSDVLSPLARDRAACRPA